MSPDPIQREWNFLELKPICFCSVSHVDADTTLLQAHNGWQWSLLWQPCYCWMHANAVHTDLSYHAICIHNVVLSVGITRLNHIDAFPFFSNFTSMEWIFSNLLSIEVFCMLIITNTYWPQSTSNGRKDRKTIYYCGSNE